MNELFEAIKGKKFAVFGRAGIDLFCDEVGIKSENSQIFRSDLGGSSANICAGLVKLGSQASLITSVSDDAIGRFALNRLRDYGVDTKYVKTISGECRTSLAIYESTLDNFQNVIYRNNAADFQVEIADVDLVPYNNYSAIITAGTVFASEPSRTSTFHAIENARPQITRITLDEFDATWGELGLKAVGTVDVDERGLPTGEVAIKAKNWRKMIEIAEASGAIAPELVSTVTGALQFVAGLSGNSKTLDVTLRLSGGAVFLGPIPIGAAPIIKIR